MISASCWAPLSLIRLLLNSRFFWICNKKMKKYSFLESHSQNIFYNDSNEVTIMEYNTPTWTFACLNYYVVWRIVLLFKNSILIDYCQKRERRFSWNSWISTFPWREQSHIFLELCSPSSLTMIKKTKWVLYMKCFMKWLLMIRVSCYFIRTIVFFVKPTKRKGTITDWILEYSSIHILFPNWSNQLTFYPPFLC